MKQLDANDTRELAKAGTEYVAIHVGKQASAIGENLKATLDKSIKDQPYTTLAMAAAAAFVVEIIWRS